MNFQGSHQEGGWAMMLGKARGCPDEQRPGGVSATGSDEVGRATGALMTGQRRPKQSHGPRCRRSILPLAHAERQDLPQCLLLDGTA